MRENTQEEMHYRAILSQHLPGLQIDTLSINQMGWDSVVLDVNGEWIFRFPRRPEIEAQHEKEIALLPALSGHLHAAVPRFEVICRRSAECKTPFVGYRKIAGNALSVQGGASEALCRSLGEFLTELHSFPMERAASLLGIPPANVDDWKRRYEDFYDRARALIFPLLGEAVQAKVAAFWESYLGEEENFQFEPVLIHADLASEHILIDPKSDQICGIIDWEDAAIGDPALDFVGLLWAGGGEFVKQIQAYYQGCLGGNFVERMHFYRDIIPFHEIQFGLLTSDKIYIRGGLRNLHQIFGFMDE
ncbi:MAG: hypothetical protein EHM70_11960 [Chloroflexota bacterium]|nr:MAG: hypothetical protein EHM70_11960 [Chloroflexota bacterium]